MKRTFKSVDYFKTRSQFTTSCKLFDGKLQTKESIDLSQYCPFVYDQGQLGSCTANAFCMSDLMLQGIKGSKSLFQPSRLFFYYTERVAEGGNPADDSGADVVFGEKYTKLNGVCSEQNWPYIVSKYATKPPQSCFTEAEEHKISSFNTIPLQNRSVALSNLKSLLSNNVPVLMAFNVYDSFMNTTNGIIPMPNKDTESVLGGHEVCVVGFNDKTGHLKLINSWGNQWGIDGFCYVPFGYILDQDITLELTYFSE